MTTPAVGRRFAAVGVVFALVWGYAFAARGAVVFSEIMYNPVAGALAGDEYEFLELYNTGSSTVNLHGAQFIQGIAYTFTNVALAASSYVVVARNRTAFTNRYPAVTNLAPGFYGGSLANGGEAVTLTNASGAAYCSVTYGDSGGWPTWPDGQGASLQLREMGAANLSDPTNWCSSLLYNGTPGAAGDCWLAQVLINEVLTHTDPPLEDAVEVYNASTGSVNLFGWYLSDDAAIRKKYRITNAAPVAAGGYTVFYQYQFDTNAFFDTNNIPFALDSAQGDSVYLTAADGASNLTALADLQTVEASANGVSFGRYPNGTGEVTTLRSLTFGTTNPPTLAAFRAGTGAANALPLVGPLVISEIMYHPASDAVADEFVELLNVSTGSVGLFDVLFPSNTWKLASAVDFTFPTGVTLAAGQRLLVTGASNLPAFRSAYGLASNAAVYGPWAGQLDNAGESVRLYKPDPPQTNGFVPYVLVDRVDYGDDLPWPTAPDGNGPSLERMVYTNFGNTDANWFTGGPGGSPGAAPDGGFVNPQVKPAAPANGQMVTVTVSVVAQVLPTQVLLRTAANGVYSNRVLRDNGVAPDAVSNDQLYSVSFAAPTNAWLYYRFLAYAGGQEAFVLPARETKFTPAPTLSLGLCNKGTFATVQPVEQWVSYSVTGTASDTSCFYLYLNAAGEALLDDVFVFDGGGTNHLANSTFNTSLSTWNTHPGSNHAATAWENPASEGSNGVMHVRATGPGSTPGRFEDSVSAGFSPNVALGQPTVLQFRTRQAGFEIDQWYALLVGSAPPDVAINEIMYHPAGTNDGTCEYVELYNNAGVAVNLSDWILDGVGNFRLPTGSVIAANGFLVLAANTNALMGRYGITNVLGNWGGELSNAGETIALFNEFGREVDRVTYNDRDPWPVPADGFGPSLERLNPAAPGNTSLNWLATFAETDWRQVTWTGTVSAANGGIRFYLDFDGMAWIDDVSIKSPGGTNNLLPNGDFESGMTGWTGGGNHARSRVHSGQGRTGAALALFGNESRYIYPDTTNFPDAAPGVVERYGDATSNCVSSGALPTTNGDAYVVTWWARRERLADHVFGVLAGVTNALTLGREGSPGATNSTATTNAPIQILDVTQSSNVVAVGFTNVVRARIQPAGLVSNVTLKYRIYGTNNYQFTDRNYANQAMRDDGVAPDTAAGDGWYAAYAPATSNWRLVRYEIFAAASNGYSARSPATDDPSLDYGFWVQSGSPQTNIPNWFILVDGSPVMYPIGTRGCAIAPDGRVYNDIVVRHRGHVPGDTNTAQRSGVTLRMFNGNLLDAWFASNQEGIIFRNRGNDYASDYSRVVSEPVAYTLQRDLGLPSPRVRHVVLWFNGNPAVTVELELPQVEFLQDHGIPTSDYMSRASYSDLRHIVAGDPSLDNLDEMKYTMTNSALSARNGVVWTNLWLESLMVAMALENLVGDGDQYFDWNNFQHRRASDGRWTQYAWDLDICFNTNVPYAVNQTTNLHPYYQTTLHPSIWMNDFVQPMGQALFYPETGSNAVYTLPYRYRMQRALWRSVHTWFTTNYLFPKFDALQAQLLPVYTSVIGYTYFFTDRVAEAKTFVLSRRDFLMNQSWSDKMTNIWAPGQVYNPSNVVLNEIMASPPPGGGGEYVELYNPSTQYLDLGAWRLQAGEEEYRLPFGTMLGPTSFLVVADTQTTLTNAYAELGAASNLVERYPGYRLWDFPIVFTTATEFASRIVEIDALTLPGTGATVRLLDTFSNVIDVVTFSTNAPWPAAAGVAMELIDPLADNSLAANWRASLIVGTPGTRNTANADADNDAMNDGWEQQIVNASSGGIASVTGVLAGADFDGDGLLNGEEFVLGTSPTAVDDQLADLAIALSNGLVQVGFGTQAPTGSAYDLFSARLYSLQANTDLMLSGWNAVTDFIERAGDGTSLVYSNSAPAPGQHYRYDIRLRYKRP